jgi:DNA-binding IclR family transcriptional regulator
MVVSAERKANLSISVSRMRAVLQTIADSSKGASAAEVSAELGISRPAALRMLESMVAHGIARRDNDSKRYFLGLLLYQWGAKAVRTFLPSTLIQHELLALAREAGHPAFYAVLDDDAVVVIERTEVIGGQTVVVPYAARYHWSSSTTGPVLVAFSAPETIDRLMAQDVRTHSEAIWAPEEMPALIEQVQHQGYLERTLGVGRTTIAAPVLDYSGHVVAALGLAVSYYNETDQERLKQVLRVAVEKCSGLLGHVGEIAVL